MRRKEALEFRPLRGRCRSETGAPLPCALRSSCRNAVSWPPHAAIHARHSPHHTTLPHTDRVRQRSAGLRPASRPQAAKPTKMTTRRTRGPLSPRRSLWRGCHPAKGSPGVSPAARAVPAGDRRSTAVRASVELSERGFVAPARRHSRTHPTTTTTLPHTDRVRQRSAGLRPASRPQAAKPTKMTTRRTRGPLSPRHSLWRGRHAAKGSPGVSPAARAMPAGDRRFTPSPSGRDWIFTGTDRRSEPSSPSSCGSSWRSPPST